MIDLKRLRDEPEYRRGIERKRVREGLIDEVLEADAAHRTLVSEVEGLRARQNAASKEIGKAAPDRRDAMREAAGLLKEELTAQEKELQSADARVTRAGAPGAESGRRVGARRRRGRRRGRTGGR